MEMQRTEEETIEHMKEWLKENGLAIVLGLVIGLSGIVGVRYWFNFQQTHAEEASLIYDKVVSSLEAQQYVDVMQQAKTLQDQHSGTSYAVLAAMAMAKASLATGDSATARDHLEWAIDKTGDESLQHIARIRLARLFVDAKDYTEALKLITDQTPGAFASLYDELRGDILAAQNNVSLARAAYRTAVVDAKDPSRRDFIQMKLDDLTIDIQPVVPLSSEVIKK